MLKAVAYGWRQARIEQNAEQISALGRELYVRILAMASHVDDVRRHFERAIDSFNKSVGSLESRVLPAARRFRELGAAPGEEIPQVEPVQTTPRILQAPELRTLLDVVDASIEEDGRGREPRDEERRPAAALREEFSLPLSRGSLDEW